MAGSLATLSRQNPYLWKGQYNLMMKALITDKERHVSLERAVEIDDKTLTLIKLKNIVYYFPITFQNTQMRVML